MKNKTTRPARLLKTSAKLLGGLYIFVWIFLTLNKTTGGDLNGVSLLLPAVIMLLLMLVALRSPLIGGAALMVVGLALGTWVSLKPPEGVNITTSVLLIGGPYVLVGLLFLLVGVLAKNKPIK